MNLAFKLMFLTMVINFSVGIIFTAMPWLDNNTSNLKYNNDYSGNFTGTMQTSVNPSGVLQDKGNAIYRVLDMLNIGFIQKFLTTVKNYMYGFVVILDNIAGQYLDAPLHTLLFAFPLGILYVLMNIMYIYGAWALWTGRFLG